MPHDGLAQRGDALGRRILAAAVGVLAQPVQDAAPPLFLWEMRRRRRAADEFILRAPARGLGTERRVELQPLSSVGRAASATPDAGRSPDVRWAPTKVPRPVCATKK